jgi:hypothetical protein
MLDATHDLTGISKRVRECVAWALVPAASRLISTLRLHGNKVSARVPTRQARVPAPRRHADQPAGHTGACHLGNARRRFIHLFRAARSEAKSGGVSFAPSVAPTE